MMICPLYLLCSSLFFVSYFNADIFVNMMVIIVNTHVYGCFSAIISLFVDDSPIVRIIECILSFAFMFFLQYGAIRKIITRFIDGRFIATINTLDRIVTDKHSCLNRTINTYQRIITDQHSFLNRTIVIFDYYVNILGSLVSPPLTTFSIGMENFVNKTIKICSLYVHSLLPTTTTHFLDEEQTLSKKEENEIITYKPPIPPNGRNINDYLIIDDLLYIIFEYASASISAFEYASRFHFSGKHYAYEKSMKLKCREVCKKWNSLANLKFNSNWMKKSKLPVQISLLTLADQKNPFRLIKASLEFKRVTKNFSTTWEYFSKLKTRHTDVEILNIETPKLASDSYGLICKKYSDPSYESFINGFPCPDNLFLYDKEKKDFFWLGKLTWKIADIDKILKSKFAIKLSSDAVAICAKKHSNVEIAQIDISDYYVPFNTDTFTFRVKLSALFHPYEKDESVFYIENIFTSGCLCTHHQLGVLYPLYYMKGMQEMEFDLDSEGEMEFETTNSTHSD